MKRRIELDAARGAMLVWMTLTHLPTMLTPWVNQPFGYISASEGFIFLSALFTGRIYFRVLERDGAGAMTWKLFLRALRLYRYHVALLFAAFVVVARFAISSHNQNLYNLLDFYFAAGPARAITAALLLVYRPPLLDIIPLYLIFLLLSPLTLIVAVRIGWKYVLGASSRDLAARAVRPAPVAIWIRRASPRSANPSERDGRVQSMGLAVHVDFGHVVRRALG